MSQRWPRTEIALHSTTRASSQSSLAGNSRQTRAGWPRPKLTVSALPGAPFSDGDRAGTKPNGFELLCPRPQPFRKGSPAHPEGSQTTMRVRPYPISVQIRELSYSSSSDQAVQNGRITPLFVAAFEATPLRLGGIADRFTCRLSSRLLASDRRHRCSAAWSDPHQSKVWRGRFGC